jgi:hypothetical protein
LNNPFRDLSKRQLFISQPQYKEIPEQENQDEHIFDLTTLLKKNQHKNTPKELQKTENTKETPEYSTVFTSKSPPKPINFTDHKPINFTDPFKTPEKSPKKTPPLTPLTKDPEELKNSNKLKSLETNDAENGKSRENIGSKMNPSDKQVFHINFSHKIW